MSKTDVKHRGRLAQTGIYLGKLLRMFVYQNDWKVLPIGAFIAAVVTFVVGQNMFVTQEGTFNGAFALTCVCIWNGFFNSIQVICRERPILKREHRAGLHITAYVASHMIYQLLLCAAQAAVTMFICNLVGVKFPAQGVVTRWGMVDMPHGHHCRRYQEVSLRHNRRDPRLRLRARGGHRRRNQGRTP